MVWETTAAACVASPSSPATAGLRGCQVATCQRLPGRLAFNWSADQLSSTSSDAPQLASPRPAARPRQSCSPIGEHWHPHMAAAAMWASPLPHGSHCHVGPPFQLVRGPVELTQLVKLPVLPHCGSTGTRPAARPRPRLASILRAGLEFPYGTSSRVPTGPRTS